MEIENLRKEVKKELIDLGFDYPRAQANLAEVLNINPRSLNMALSGYRRNKGSHQILSNLLKYLRTGEDAHAGLPEIS